jgi:tetratricopeptide (TPR) repeat protein
VQQNAATAAKLDIALNSSQNSNNAGPLERIKRNYNEASFRQAAFEMEQIETMRLSALPPDQRAAALTKAGTQFFNRGLILEAEREFQAALAADSSSAAAHAGLAQVRERSNDLEAARQEAQKSLMLQPNVTAHLVLARMDLQANQISSAAGEVSQALQIEPGNANALGMKQALVQRGQQLP